MGPLRQMSRFDRYLKKYVKLDMWQTARDEALMDAVVMYTGDTPYPWLIACTAKMELEVLVRGRCFEGKRDGYQRANCQHLNLQMQRARRHGSRTYVRLCGRKYVQQVQKVKVVEDYYFKPHKPACQKERNHVRTLNVPKEPHVGRIFPREVCMSRQILDANDKKTVAGRNTTGVNNVGREATSKTQYFRIGTVREETQEFIQENS